MHPLLRVANIPASGGGAILYLSLAITGLESAQRLGISSAVVEWICEAVLLKDQLSALKLGRLSAPTSLDMNVKLWGGLHKLIEVRRKARGCTEHVDAVLTLGLLNFAGNGHRVSELFVQGIRSVYKCCTGSQAHRDWHALNGSQLLDEAALSKLLPTLSNLPTRAFATQLIAVLQMPAPSLASLKPLPNPSRDQPSEQDTDQIASEQKLLIHTDTDVEASNSTDLTAKTTDENETALRREFQRGDSILEWQTARGVFCQRNDRLALTSWNSLPAALTCSISSQLSVILSRESTKNKPAAALALSCLLTSTPPRVLLHAPLHPTKDFYFDLAAGTYCWNRSHLLKGTSVASVDLTGQQASMGNDEIIAIPMPGILAAELVTFSETAVEPHYFGDLFGVALGSPDWDALVNEMRELLKYLGDPAFPAHLGRWSNSGPRVHLETYNSDLMTATCTLYFGLTNVSAMHYFHPTREQIRRVCSDVYGHLGLGQPVDSRGTDNVEANALPSDAELKAGFEKMEQDMHTHFQLVRINRSIAQRLSSFNELVRLSAAATIFTIGGRGSKIQNFKTGSVYLSQTILHVDDKDINDGRGSRLLPRTVYLSHVLARLGHAQALVASTIGKSLPKNRGDVWRELARGILRFDAEAFQWVDVRNGTPTRQPVLAADIETVAQKYFGRKKNFMRHVLITSWSISRMDRNLLRLITGHGATGLEMPAPCAVYSPRSAITEADRLLQTLLDRWLPCIDPTAEVAFTPRFSSLPARRIHKIHKANRHDLVTGISGPLLGRWHLAAEAVVNEIRKLLLAGTGPDGPEAKLWLHLVVFDGLHAPTDLDTIFENIRHAFRLGGCGWTYSFKRHGNAQPHRNPVQAPTAALLNGHPGLLMEDQPSNPADVLKEVSDWLMTSLPHCWEKSDVKSSPAEGMLACCALWCDLVVPSSLQYGYEPSNHAAMLDGFSSNQLLRLEPVFQPVQLARSNRPTAHAAGPLKNLLTIVNELGDNNKKIGELKARASLLDLEIPKLGAQADGSWVALLISALQHNNQLIRKGIKDRLEFSSLATYLSYLKPNLISLLAEVPGEYDALDWMDVSKGLRIVATEGKSGKERKTNEERQMAQHDAVNWLLKTLRASGQDIPAEALHVDTSRSMQLSSSTPITLISDAHLLHLQELLRSWHRDFPLQAIRSELIVSLLENAPLRWGEVSCTSAADLLRQEDFICIQPAGLSQIKSFMSRRLAPVPSATRALANSLRDRLRLANKDVGRETFYFLNDVNGVVDGSTAHWLHHDISTALCAITGNPSVKVHAMRARSICQLAFPDWSKNFSDWLDGSIGPLELGSYFRYDTDKAWRIDKIRCSAGHAQVRTTVAHYLYAGFQLRAMALATTLVGLRPTSTLVEAIATTMHALKKQTTRKGAVREDPWIFVQQHLPKNRVELPSHASINTSVHVSVSAEPIVTLVQLDFKDIQYVALRLTGCSISTAADALDLTVEKYSFLEVKIEQEIDASAQLRERLRGHSGGRAKAADIKLIVSDACTIFIALLKRAGTDSAETLLGLLTQKPHLCEWHERVLKLEGHFVNTPWVLECITDRRFENPDISLRLSRQPTLLISQPQRDIGRYPRVYIIPKKTDDRSTVIKARLTTMGRLLCKAHTLLFPPTI